MDENDTLKVQRIRKEVLELISSAKIEKAIGVLKNYMNGEDEDLYSQLILISSQYYAAKQKSILGIGSQEKVINEICYNLIIFTNNIECYIENKKEQVELQGDSHSNIRLNSFGYKIMIWLIVASLPIVVFNKFISKRAKIEDNAKGSELKDVRLLAATNSGVKNNYVNLVLEFKRNAIIDTVKYLSSTQLRLIKLEFIDKHKLYDYDIEPSKNVTVHSSDWVLVNKDNVINADDEWLPISDLSNKGKLSESDILELQKVARYSNTSHDFIEYLSEDNGFQLATLNYDESNIWETSTFSYVGYSNFVNVVGEINNESYRHQQQHELINEHHHIFTNYMHKPGNTITWLSNTARKEIRVLMINKFGLKGEDEFFIETEMDLNDYVALFEE